MSFAALVKSGKRRSLGAEVPAINASDRQTAGGNEEKQSPKGNRDKPSPRGSGDKQSPRGNSDRQSPKGSGDRQSPKGSGDRQSPRGNSDRQNPKGTGDRHSPGSNTDGRQRTKTSVSSGGAHSIFSPNSTWKSAADLTGFRLPQITFGSLVSVAKFPKFKKPVKFDRNMSVVVTKKVSELKGRRALFSSPPTTVTVSIPPDPELANQFIIPPTVEVATQNAPEVALHQVNTQTQEFANSGMRHAEGGWPKDVNCAEGDQTLRYRKKIEKDEFYIHSVLQLGAKIEHCIRQNNAIDIYEDYFEDDYGPSPLLAGEDPIKTVDVVRDPLAGVGLVNPTEASPKKTSTSTKESRTEKKNGSGVVSSGGSIDDTRHAKDQKISRDHGTEDAVPASEGEKISKHVAEQPKMSSIFRGRGVTSIDFNPGMNARKIAAAYSSTIFQCPLVDVPRTAYVWDISSTSRIDVSLEGPTWTHTLRYNSKEPNIIGAGLRNGQVCWWDTRSGPKPAALSPLGTSHRQVVTGVGWVPAKTLYELISVAMDGRICWWDTRQFGAPVETIQLVPGKPPAGEAPLPAAEGEGAALTVHPMTGSSMAPVGGATAKVLVGTEQGAVLAVNRRARNPGDRVGPPYGAHYAPVYSVQRNPAFPKNFLTVGDWTVKLWTEDFYSSPILSTPPSCAKLSCATWSPSRCSVLLTGRMDGALDIWDLLCRWDRPQHSLQVTDCSIESVAAHDSGELVAVGSQQGAMAVLRLPPHLARPFVKEDKAEFSSTLERETRRERVLEGRLKESRLRGRVRVPPPPPVGADPRTPEDPLQLAGEAYLLAVEQARAEMEAEEAAEEAEHWQAEAEAEAEAEAIEEEREEDLALSPNDALDDPHSSSSAEPER